MTISEARNQFPQLKEQVYGKKLVYLDNAATSLRPLAVLNAWENLSVSKNANIHRAVHRFAELATDEYEKTRDAVAGYLNAYSREEIIFTSGSTMSLNLVAQCFTERFVSSGDEIVIAESEHHSDIVPWQIASDRVGAVIKVLPVSDNGSLCVERLREMITSRTRIVCVAHISNVLGLVNPIEEICAIAHKRGCKVLVDGSQGIVHCPVDVQAIGCDFYAFSGHKMYAAPGTGVLWGRKELLEQMPPFLGGGEMISSVSFARTTYAPLPEKYEAGTQNFTSIPTLRPAIEVLKELNSKELELNIREITAFMMNALSSDERITLYGVPRGTEKKIPVFSFTVKGVHHEDLALILDKMGIAVRSGQMCAEPLMDRMGVTGMLRASFAPYNTLDEAEFFIKSLDRAINMLA